MFVYMSGREPPGAGLHAGRESRWLSDTDRMDSSTPWPAAIELLEAALAFAKQAHQEQCGAGASGTSGGPPPPNIARVLSAERVAYKLAIWVCHQLGSAGGSAPSAEATSTGRRRCDSTLLPTPSHRAH